MSSAVDRLWPKDNATIGLIVAGTLAGFFLGRLSATQTRTAASHRGPIVLVDSEEEGSDDEPEAEISQDVGRLGEECKLVLVVRTDLGMTKGKIAAQCGHATLACYKAHLKQNATSSFAAPSVLRRWEMTGQAKIAVQVKSEDELLMLQAKAVSLGICAKVIHDAGRTQIASGSATVLGVGPAPKSLIDQVTGGLKLL